jgi:hypothetical protein
MSPIESAENDTRFAAEQNPRRQLKSQVELRTLTLAISVHFANKVGFAFRISRIRVNASFTYLARQPRRPH